MKKWWSWFSLCPWPRWDVPGSRRAKGVRESAPVRARKVGIAIGGGESHLYEAVRLHKLARFSAGTMRQSRQNVFRPVPPALLPLEEESAQRGNRRIASRLARRMLNG